jgi:hypothetical protein
MECFCKPNMISPIKSPTEMGELFKKKYFI